MIGSIPPFARSTPPQKSGLRQFKLRGTEKVAAVFGLHVFAYNLIRLGNLL